MSDAPGTYGVELVRGEVVELPEHPDACHEVAELVRLSERSTRPIAADLFCGAGGLSLGLTDAGFDVLVGVDHDAYALQTHAAHMPGMHLDWDLADPERVTELCEILISIGVTLIAGGPPCQPFSKAGRSLIRDLVRKGKRPPSDVRRDMWQSFLNVIETVRPPAVLMENVPDMVLDRDMLILRTMVDELERLGYSVRAQIIETSRYGVPQFRQRVILVALQGNTDFIWPHDTWARAEPQDVPATVTLLDAIGDLPDVEPGWLGQPIGPYAGPATPFQQWARKDVGRDDQAKLDDHVTRAVREDDLAAFRILAPDTRYSELPDELKRYRDDIFDDKYKRLDGSKFSRTITAHIAKDGYWYIHPRFDRTLTIREAARIQTFRDHVRFAGPPTAALRQIGNAVPPELGRHIGAAILASLDDPRESPWTTRDVSRRLAGWWHEHDHLTVPWLAAPNRWTALQAEFLLSRARMGDAAPVWMFVATLDSPGKTLKRSRDLELILESLGRRDRLVDLLEVARNLTEQPQDLDSREGLRRAGMPPAVIDVALRIHPLENEDPVIATNGVLRVSGYFNGSDVHRRNRGSDGRVEVARLIGVDDPEPHEEAIASPAHLALMEIASRICRSDDQDHDRCPLQEWCLEAKIPAREPRLALEAS